MSLALTIQLFGPDSPLHLPAYRFFIDPARFVLGLAGRRGAKTYTAAKKFIQRVWDDFARRKQLLYLPGAARRGTVLWWQRRARLHYWICADTYELLDEPKRYLLQFLPEELIDHVDNAKGRWWLKGDILIEFKTVRNPQKKVGSGLDGMWIEEAARVRADAWPLYLRPALADKQGWCIATTTPLGRDWTWEAFERPANDHVPGYSSHWWPTAANTRAPGLQAEVAHARATLAPEYFEREWEASRQAFIGQVYRGFARARVSVSKLPDGIQFQRILGGCDWGFSNPGALLVAGILHRCWSKTSGRRRRSSCSKSGASMNGWPIRLNRTIWSAFSARGSGFRNIATMVPGRSTSTHALCCPESERCRRCSIRIGSGSWARGAQI